MGSSSSNRLQLYDEVRGRWVKATPEEQVRQRWLKWMIGKLEYPKELLAVEKELKELPHLFGVDLPERRIDILCYGKGSHLLYPLLMIECKEGKLTEEAINQAIGYNHHVKACFIAIVNLEETRFGLWVPAKKNYEFYPILPSYKELMKWVRP
jgi:hypothetical protein